MKFETILKYREWYLCQISRTNHAIQARNQNFMWGGAYEAKVDQTTEMYSLLSDPLRKVAIREKL